MEPIYEEFSVKNKPESVPLIQKYIDRKCTWFDDSGNICEVANYLVGMLHGENVGYNADGTLKFYDYYEFGIRVSNQYFGSQSFPQRSK